MKTENELKLQRGNIAKINEIASQYGIDCCFHNHGATKALAQGDLDSVTIYDGNKVKLCIDTGWAYVSGFDPIEWIHTYVDRVGVVHLRNQYGTIPSAQFDNGKLDVKKIITALKNIGYAGWLTSYTTYLKRTRLFH